MVSQKYHDKKVRRAELIISIVLQVGVTASAVILVLGLIASFTHHGVLTDSSASYHQVTSSSYTFPHTISSVRTSLQAGNSQGYIMLGLLVLILTPVLRVATSVFLFIYERDTAMVLVTLFVLIVLISSYFVGVTT